MALKVLHIINSLGVGGAQGVLKYLVENLPEGEVESFVYPLRDHNIDIQVCGNIIRHGRRFYDPRKILDIIRICRKHKIDIIHSHLHKSVFAAILAKFFCRVQIVLHEHGHIRHPGWQSDLYRFLLRILKPFISRFIAVSNQIADDLHCKASIAIDRIDLVYNGIDSTRFTHNEESRQIIRQKHKIGSSEIVLGYCGRLDEIKGIDILIDALAILSRNDQRFKLILCGEGKQRQALEEQVERLGLESKVIFMGFREDVSPILSAVDLAVIPSRDEALGLVPIEFMSMGIPVICSGVGGLAEIVLHRKTGMIAHPNTAIRIAETVREILDNNDLREAITTNGKKLAEQFNITSCTSKVLEVYKKICPEE